MNIEDFDQGDDLTGTLGEHVRRAIRRFAADTLELACGHPYGAHVTALTERRTWCEFCAERLGLPEQWEQCAACMTCGRALGEDRYLGRGGVWGGMVWMTTCFPCADEFAALQREER